MAYQVRHRDPIFDADTQAMFEQRGRELLGLVLMLIGIVLCLMLGSYTQDDPSWLSVTEEPAQNMLGRFGAALASPLYIIIGWGSWVLAAFCLTWGWRFIRHIGTDRAMSRVVFAPIAVALVAVFASTNVPSASWTHSFGLGGLFGDTVLGAVLGILPVSATFGLKFLSLATAIGSVFMVLFVIGFTLPEMRDLARWIVLRLIEAYAYAVELGLRLSGRATSTLQSMRENRAQRLEYAAEQLQYEAEYEPEPEPYPTLRAEPSVTSPRAADPQPTTIYRAHVAAPVVATDDADYDDGAPVPEVDDRVKARIFNAIRQRAESRVDGRSEPPLMRPAPIIAPKTYTPPVAAVVQSIEVYPDDVSLDVEIDEGEFMPDEFMVDGIVADDYLAEPLDLDAMDDVYEAHAPLVAPIRPHHVTPETRAVVQHNIRKPTAPSRKAMSEAQPSLGFDEQASEYSCPPLSLLENPVAIKRHVLSDESLTENARMLENVLDDYGVKGEITSVRPGPVVTMYELEPAPGLKASRVIGLSDDIARSMSALSARVSTVPGRTVIGIELPNAHREKVVLREILSARDFGDSQMRLPLALGKDISGDPVVANLAKMPHLLIAGTTGSGKSVAINTMIL
ncbi:MAG: DNA translocase FtsK 4TM domain-containing protein, partial [Deltaproteobacteria bacterium]